MKILVTNPPAIFRQEEGLQEYLRVGARWPTKKRVGKRLKMKPRLRYLPFPFFLAYTAAVLRRNGHSVSVVDAGSLGLDEAGYVEEVRRRHPDLAVMETSADTVKLDAHYMKRIREETGARVLFAGPHASVQHKETLERYPHVDFCAIGEYEYTAAELAERLDRGKPVDDVLGLAYRANGSIRANERRPLIEPLDQLPFPARDLFPADGSPDPSYYFDAFTKVPAIQLHSTRGCPFTCNFCVWPQIIYGSRKYRMFSPKYTVDEMEHCMKEFGIRSFYFDDDTLTINKKHVLALCQEIRERDLDVQWSAMCDAIMTDEEMVREMARAGCVAMKFGVESADPEVLATNSIKFRGGKPLDPKKIEQHVEWCKKHGIRTHATFCVGLVGETRESVQRTVDFMCRLDIDGLQISRAIPYAGTSLYDTVSEAGWLKTVETPVGVTSTIERPGLSSAEADQIQAQAYKVWFHRKSRDPRWVLRRARENYREGGLPEVFRGLKRQVQRMLEREPDLFAGLPPGTFVAQRPKYNM